MIRLEPVVHPSHLGNYTSVGFLGPCALPAVLGLPLGVGLHERSLGHREKLANGVVETLPFGVAGNDGGRQRIHGESVLSKPETWQIYGLARMILSGVPYGDPLRRRLPVYAFATQKRVGRAAIYSPPVTRPRIAASC